MIRTFYPAPCIPHQSTPNIATFRHCTHTLAHQSNLGCRHLHYPQALAKRSASHCTLSPTVNPHRARTACITMIVTTGTLPCHFLRTFAFCPNLPLVSLTDHLYPPICLESSIEVSAKDVRRHIPDGMGWKWAGRKEPVVCAPTPLTISALRFLLPKPTHKILLPPNL